MDATFIAQMKRILEDQRAELREIDRDIKDAEGQLDELRKERAETARGIIKTEEFLTDYDEGER